MKQIRLSSDEKLLGKELLQVTFKGEEGHRIDFHSFIEDPDFCLQGSLEPDAKMTDIANASYISAIGFLVSSRLKELMSNFNISEHRFYPTLISDKKQVHDYYYYHSESLWPAVYDIDIHDSLFEIFDPYTATVVEGDLSFNHIDDLVSLIKKTNSIRKMIRAKSLSFSTYHKYDLFYLGIGSMEFMVSDRFAEFLIEEKISGVEICDASFIS